MSARGRELVATDEPSVVTKSPFGAIVMEDGEGGGRLSNPTGAN